MSATLQQDAFSAYFNSCPVISVPGREYPVRIQYILDVDTYIRQKQAEVHCHRVYGDGNALGVDGVDDPSGKGGRGRGHGRGRGRGGGDQGRGKGSRMEGSPAHRVGTSAVGVIPPTLDIDRVVELILRIIQGYSSKPHDALCEISRNGLRGKGKVKATAAMMESVDDIVGLVGKVDVQDSAVGKEEKGEGMGQAILVFLSGIQAITAVSKAIRNRGIEAIAGKVNTSLTSTSTSNSTLTAMMLLENV